MSDRISILVKINDVESDEKLLIPGNNGRKISSVAGALKNIEEKIFKNAHIWKPDDIWEVKRGGLEISTFNENSRQERHYHKMGVETFFVIKGKITINIDNLYECHLEAGDEYIVDAGVVHQVTNVSKGTLVRVHAISYGEKDKFVQLQKNGKWCCWAYLSDEDKKNLYKW